jgi:hypothetical protein
MDSRTLPMDLVEAVQQGRVTLEAKPESSFAETRVRVQKKSADGLALDFSRSGLIPTQGDSQRIGLSYPKGFSPGDYVLSIDPGQTSEIVFNSRCLDESRPAPTPDTVYGLIPQLLPEPIVAALRDAMEQEQLWELLSSLGETWGADDRPVPSITHSVLLGEWECSIPGNRYRMLVSWNDQEQRYEGHLTQNSEISAEAGFMPNELIYVAYVTADPLMLSEQQKFKGGSGGVSFRESWGEGTVDLHQWTSWNVGVFAANAKMIRVG